jgi:hypothetical protein
MEGIMRGTSHVLIHWSCSGVQLATLRSPDRSVGMHIKQEVWRGTHVAPRPGWTHARRIQRDRKRNRR